MDGYTFDRGKLKDFDSQRHEIVHGSAFGKSLTRFPVSDENLRFILQTVMFLTGLVNYKYGLQIDPQFVGDFWQQKTPRT